MAGSDDEESDRELRTRAVDEYIGVLQKAAIPDILLHVAAWVRTRPRVVSAIPRGRPGAPMPLMSDQRLYRVGGYAYPRRSPGP